MQPYNEAMNIQRIFTVSAIALTALFCSCQKSIEEKAAQDAAEYTRKYCPTPTINYSRTDSVTFDKTTHVYTYYCTFTDALDNEEVIRQNKQKISEVLASSVKESTAMKPYVQAGFHFQYVCRSEKDPKVILFQVKF